MKEENKKEEIQSRREFFKEAAKKGLPIIGAVALMSNPMIAKAVTSDEELGCDWGCSGRCTSCSGSCYGSCSGGCSGCTNSCKGGCVGYCSGGCQTGCTGWSR